MFSSARFKVLFMYCKLTSTIFVYGYPMYVFNVQTFKILCVLYSVKHMSFNTEYKYPPWYPRTIFCDGIVVTKTELQLCFVYAYADYNF